MELKNISENVAISYKGLVKPHDVQNVFQQYHALILPTSGENFGHAIYECLSVGRPVITSNFTPWNNLKEKMAGWNIDIQETEIRNAIRELNGLKAVELAQYYEGAHRMAAEYFFASDFETNYKTLFSLT